MTTPATLHGFIIANKDWSDEVKLAMGKTTISRLPADAWRRHIGRDKSASRDFPILVQRWHDKGYKPFRVTLTLEPESEV